MKRSLFAGLGIAAALVLWTSGSAFSAGLTANQAEKQIKACAKAQITLLKATPLPAGKSAKALKHRIRVAVKMVHTLVKNAERTIDSQVDPLEDRDDAASAQALAALDFTDLRNTTCAAIANVKVDLTNLPAVQKTKAIKKGKKHEKELEDAGKHADRNGDRDRGEANEVER